MHNFDGVRDALVKGVFSLCRSLTRRMLLVSNSEALEDLAELATPNERPKRVLVVPGDTRKASVRLRSFIITK